MRTYLTILAGLLLCGPAFSQSPETQVREADSIFWAAYNRCDIETMHRYLADDLEFYHDKGGIQRSWTEFETAMRRNICARPDWHLRREAIKGSVAFYAMEDNGKLYGAILSGDHKFWVTETGKPEFWSGSAKFTHVWLLRDGIWKMHRILSYDHRPAR